MREVSPNVTSLDATEKSLRPTSLDDYIGQEDLKRNLKIFIEAAKTRGEPLDHILLHGPPGLGKTSLAYVIASEMGVDIRVTSGPAIERAGDLVSILTNLKEGDVLFIDEIHRMNRVIEEVLYPAMEDFRVDIVVGKGPSARTLRLRLPRFTLIAATTRIGLLTSPLRNRFGCVFRLDYYSVEELKRIVLRSSRILGIEVTCDGAEEIAKRARGTPRIANRLLRRVRDYAQVLGDGKIDKSMASKALDELKVDEMGLDEMDRKLLITIVEKFSGGPVGIETLATSVGEERDTIEDVYEPYLMREGFIKRTPRGRVATEKTYQYLKLRRESPIEGFLKD